MGWKYIFLKQHVWLGHPSVNLLSTVYGMQAGDCYFKVINWCFCPFRKNWSCSPGETVWTKTFLQHYLQKIDLPSRGIYGFHELTECWQNFWIPDQNTVCVKLCERAAALAGWGGWALSSLCADVSAVNSGGRLARVWKMEKPLLRSG